MKPVKFTSQEKRDELGKALVRLAEHMLRCRDQGHDNRIRPTDDDYEIVMTAAAVVMCCEIEPESSEVTVRAERDEWPH